MGTKPQEKEDEMGSPLTLSSSLVPAGPPAQDTPQLACLPSEVLSH